MRQLAVAMALVTAACAGNGTDAAESTTTAAPVAETTITTTSTTVAPTTSSPPRQKLIGPGTQFEPGAVYRGSLPVQAIEFELEFRLDGWKVFNIPANTGDYILVVNQEPELFPGAAATVIYWMGDQTVDDVAALYLSEEAVERATEPLQVTVGGNDALQFDLLLAPGDEPDPEDACFGVTMSVDNMAFDSGLFFEQLSACTWIRVWVVQVDEFAVSAYIMVVGADKSGLWLLDPDNVWQIEDFQPLLDDFINGLTFCTATTPCND